MCFLTAAPAGADAKRRACMIASDDNTVLDTEATSLAHTEETFVGRVLGERYRLDERVGRGAMGAVFRARHITMDKAIAVKLLHRQFSNDETLVARFRREALAASRLRHPSCVEVYDFDRTPDGMFYIAMEFIEGTTLAAERVKDGRLALDRALHVMHQVLDGLDVAHEAGVLHRDVKPQNIMLQQKPGLVDHVKLVDFGIAKLTQPSALDQRALTVPGTIFGTPEYMAPEQAFGETLDARCDVYAAGAVLLELLIGRSPFRGASVRATLGNVLDMKPPRIADVRSDIPDGIQEAIDRALSKERTHRYDSAGAFLQALHAVARSPEQPAPSDGGENDDGASPRKRTMVATLPKVDVETAPTDASQSALAGPASSGTRLALHVPAEPAGSLAVDAPAQGGQPRERATVPVAGADDAESAQRGSRTRWGQLGVVAAAALVASFAGTWAAGALLSRQPPAQKPVVAPVEKPAPPVQPAALAVPADATERLRLHDAAIADAEHALQSREMQRAAKAYARALVLTPASTRARAGLANAAFRAGELVEARRHVAWLVAQGPPYDTQYARFLRVLDARIAAKGASPVHEADKTTR